MGSIDPGFSLYEISIYIFELVLSNAAFKPFAIFSGSPTAQKCIMNNRGIVK